MRQRRDGRPARKLEFILQRHSPASITAALSCKYMCPIVTHRTTNPRTVQMDATRKASFNPQNNGMRLEDCLKGDVLDILARLVAFLMQIE